MSLRVLMVCEGNTCRSPLAERLLVHRVAERAGGPGTVRVASAGVRAVVGAPMDPSAAAELEKRGGSPEGFAARALTVDQIDAAHVVVAATREIRAGVLEVGPMALRRTFTLRELAALLTLPDLTGETPDDQLRWAATHRPLVGGLDLDVPDPIHGTPQLHRHVATLIDEAVTALAGRWATSNPGTRPR